MISYKVVQGDTLSGIAYKYQTTVQILLEDNPSITNPNVIQAGSIIKIRSSMEYAKSSIEKATSITKEVSKLASSIATKSVLSNSVKKEEDRFAGLTITTGQRGVVKWKVDGGIYRINVNGNLRKTSSVSKGGRYRFYGEVEEFGGLYVLGGTNLFAKKSEVTVEEVPIATLTNDGPSTVSEDEVSSFEIPQFELPEYKRTRMKVRKADGAYLTIEMRVTSFTPNYSSQYAPSRTNAGWLISVGGANLTPLSITGFFLDTKSNLEARKFLNLYKTHFVPKSDADYFSAEVVTILHKSWEYKGVIQSLSMPDTVEQPLHRNFQMQFLCFSDKAISSAEIKKEFPDTVDRNEMTELEFRSDIYKMLANPLTGEFTIDYK